MARYFRSRARDSFDLKALGPGQFNDSALAKHFAEWRREGYESNQIRAMIEIFCSTAKPAPGKNLWHSFVNQRIRLHAQSEQKVRSTRPAREIYFDPPAQTEDDFR